METQRRSIQLKVLLSYIRSPLAGRAPLYLIRHGVNCKASFPEAHAPKRVSLGKSPTVSGFGRKSLQAQNVPFLRADSVRMWSFDRPLYAVVIYPFYRRGQQQPANNAAAFADQKILRMSAALRPTSDHLGSNESIPQSSRRFDIQFQRLKSRAVRAKGRHRSALDRYERLTANKRRQASHKLSGYHC
jgi:hypothetical protein